MWTNTLYNVEMKQTLMIKLNPDPEQYKALSRTMERFSEACNYASKQAFTTRTYGQYHLHKLVYRYLRTQYGLSAQMAIRAIARVSESYKANRQVQHIFRPHSAVVYDQRILSWKGLDKVSILTLDGRQAVPIRIGVYQESRIDRKVRQSDLILRKGIFYLATVVDAPEATPDDPTGTLGVDLGVINLAVDSDGQAYSGEAVDRVRDKMEAIKANLQSCGTKSAKRHLRKLKGRGD
jgi:putative transposase